MSKEPSPTAETGLDEQVVDEQAVDEQVVDEQSRPGRASRGLWLLLLALTLVLTVADQWSKDWAQRSLRQNHGGSFTVMRGSKLAFGFTYVRNRGAAWGFLADANESFRAPFFFVITLLAMTFILYLYARLRPGQRLLAIAFALVLSGALGNFIDRMRFSYVIDFIDVRYATFRWPTFNIADIAISIGVTLLLLESFFGPRWERARCREAQDEGGSPS